MFIKYNPKLKEVARQMRNNMTPSELLVWKFLKDKYPEYLFYRQKSLSNFIVDFYCSKLKLIIEVDGDIHLKQREKDIERDDYFLQNFNIKTLRIGNDEVLNGDFRKIENFFKM